MQTFLPYESFKDSAAVLDYRRLGKQRVECLQILQTLAKGQYTCEHCGYTGAYLTCPTCVKKNKITPWYNHPAVQMWKGYEIALVRYGWYICGEWINKHGFKDNLTYRILNFVPKDKNVDDFINPPWLGNNDFHLSHKSNLIRKKPEHYKSIFNDVPDNLPYYWPTKGISK